MLKKYIDQAVNYKKIFSKILIFVCAFTLPTFAMAKNNEAVLKKSLQDMVNQYVDINSSDNIQKNGTDISGMELTVLHNGKMQTFVAGKVGHGSNYALITPANLFQYGSITKEFATAAILKLRAKNELSLQDTLADWFPKNFISSKNKKSLWPQAWAQISIEQLLNMTSGIPDYESIPAFLNKTDLLEINWHHHKKELMAFPVNYERSGQCGVMQGCFPAGTSWNYSNTDYVIAAMIAKKAKEKAAGDIKQKNNPYSFGKQMRALLKQANIKAYYYPSKKPSYLPEAVHGYCFDAAYGEPTHVPLGTDARNYYNASTGADSALTGNTQTLASGIYKLFHAQVISKKLTHMMKSDDYINISNGVAVSNIAQCTNKNTQDDGCYGLGLIILYSHQLGPIWYYPGGNMGYQSMYIWAPKENTLIAVSVNSSAGGNVPIIPFTFNVFDLVIGNTESILLHAPKIKIMMGE